MRYVFTLVTFDFFVAKLSKVYFFSSTLLEILTKVWVKIRHCIYHRYHKKTKSRTDKRAHDIKTCTGVVGNLSHLENSFYLHIVIM